MPEANGTQRANVTTESFQRDDPQEAHPAAPQVNDNYDDGNGDDDVLPRNLDPNDFENFAN